MKAFKKRLSNDQDEWIEFGLYEEEFVDISILHIYNDQFWIKELNTGLFHCIVFNEEIESDSLIEVEQWLSERTDGFTVL